MKEKIPQSLLTRLRFVRTWKEPDNFRKLRPHERQALVISDCEPDEKCAWVWVGQYNTETGLAIYDNEYVQRKLYKCLVDPLLPNFKRLVNHFSDYPSDVNPFKCFFGSGSNHNQRRNKSSVSGAVDERQIEEVLTTIEDGGFGSYSDEDLRMFMLGFGHSPVAIEEALKRRSTIK